jgi:isopentenyl-diphosphate delta-isomerase
MAEPLVILVDEHDRPTGTMGKMEAHEKGVLHRAFSAFVINNQGEWLMQQRAFSKYHSPGLWTNACCSHPAPGETVQEAAVRRMQEELGIAIEAPETLFTFQYQVEFNNGLFEHELDHVLLCRLPAQEFNLNEEEVASVNWLSSTAIAEQLEQHPEHFTHWFRLVFDRVRELIG